MVDYASPIVTILSFLGTAGAALVIVTWRLSVVVADLKAAITASRKEVEERQDSIAREFGESVSALRQKVHEVEMWARDTFVRRDSFLAVVAEVKQGFVDLGKRIETRLERMEEKIDSKT